MKFFIIISLFVTTLFASSDFSQIKVNPEEQNVGFRLVNHQLQPVAIVTVLKREGKRPFVVVKKSPGYDNAVVSTILNDQGHIDEVYLKNIANGLYSIQFFKLNPYVNDQEIQLKDDGSPYTFNLAYSSEDFIEIND